MFYKMMTPCTTVTLGLASRLYYACMHKQVLNVSIVHFRQKMAR